MTGKRSLKIAFALVWVVIVVALLGAAIKLLRDFASTPEQAPSEALPPEPPPKPEERQVKLYFANAEASSLLAEMRSLRLGNGLSSDAGVIAEELIKGPSHESLSPTIPPETRLLDAFKLSDTLVLDFSQQLQANHPGGSAGELTTVYSIVNTMTENLRGVKRVQILIEGEEIETLAGHLDLTQPLAPDTKWMATSPREVKTS